MDMSPHPASVYGAVLFCFYVFVMFRLFDLHVSVHYIYTCLTIRKPEEHARPSGTGVANTCNLHDVVLNKRGSSARAKSTLNHCAVSVAPDMLGL